MFLRIDDVSNDTFVSVKKICDAFSFFPWNIFLSFIPSQIQKDFIQEFKKYSQVWFFFHGWDHTKDEFIKKKNIQNISFLEAKNFALETQINFFWFCPPYNSFSKETLFLASLYNYKCLSIDYKSYNLYLKQWYDFSSFKICKTRYFFNKMTKERTWYIDESDIIKNDITHIDFSPDMGIEIHPQHIVTQEDWEKLTFLSSLLLWKK